MSTQAEAQAESMKLFNTMLRDSMRDLKRHVTARLREAEKQARAEGKPYPEADIARMMAESATELFGEGHPLRAELTFTAPS